MKYIIGYEGLYSVSKKGKVFGHRQKKFLKPWLIGHGYETVMLYKDRETRKFLVHRLVAITFKPNPLNLLEVNHINANRLDNRPENLEWVSSKENKQHAIKRGLYRNLGKNSPKGSKHYKAKLSEKDVRDIRRKREEGFNIAILSKEYAVTDTSISYICLRKTWKHI